MSFTIPDQSNDPRFKTNNRLGLPLDAPSSQVLLPVICGGNGNIKGYFTIAQTAFTGAETSFALAEASVQITTVTLPAKADDGKHRVKQYMAAWWPDDMESQQPWRGYAAFVDPHESGYLYRHYMPSQGYTAILNRGTLITGLQVSMDNNVPGDPAPTAPTAANATMAWKASMSVNSAQLNAGFFDFNWVTLFQAKSASIAERIEVVSNPATGEFKSSLVPTPVITPLGGVEFNTVRIIKLKEAAAGNYVFTYRIFDDNGLSTTCTLTLTIA